MKPYDSIPRRHLVLGALLVPLAPLANAIGRTPAASEGPFYPTPAMRFSDIDNDLVKVASPDDTSIGEVIRIRGKVLNQQGEPLPSATVEIWQCDANGRYLHTMDRGNTPRDPGFQGFGRDVTNAAGEFSFRTIKPVEYPGRTPHIHVKVLDGERELLTTQWYLADHPQNIRDFLFRRLSDAERERVLLRFDSAPEANATLDLVV
jgi:protocatechuate 3,4-dioxygenase beta subunit